MVAFTPADARRLLDHPDPSQLLFQLKEIFDDRCYLHHGVALEPGAVVLDVGANVGVAAVFFAEQGARCTVSNPLDQSSRCCNGTS